MQSIIYVCSLAAKCRVLIIAKCCGAIGIVIRVPVSLAEVDVCRLDWLEEKIMKDLLGVEDMDKFLSPDLNESASQ